MTSRSPAIDCPTCRQPMAQHELEAHYGRRIVIDHCPGCAAFWFDGTESMALTPRAALELFTLIQQGAPTPPAPALAAPACPRCRVRLVEATDTQGGTRFHYARCPSDHGRLIGHLDFLREKRFVRPLSPAEVAELREKVRQVSCSTCGAPVDLTSASACGYCRAPLTMLDPHQVDRVLEELRRSDAARATALRELPVNLLGDRLAVNHLFDRIEGPPVGGHDLVRLAAAAVAGMLAGAALPRT